MVELKDETFNKVMNVLGTLPFNQVAGLIMEIQREVQRMPQSIKDIKERKANEGKSGKAST